jgi:hypothetical protein
MCSVTVAIPFALLLVVYDSEVRRLRSMPPTEIPTSILFHRHCDHPMAAQTTVNLLEGQQIFSSAEPAPPDTATPTPGRHTARRKPRRSRNRGAEPRRTQCNRESTLAEALARS